jgi:hypothetical protein
MSQRINIDSNLWGPKGWFFLDTIVLSYPEMPSFNDIKIFKNFFKSIEDILPCTKCRLHFGNYLNKYPLDDSILSSKINLIKWWLKCHNNTRKQQNKELISLDDFYNYYAKQNNLQINKETSEVKSNIIENFYFPNYVSIVSIICIFIVLILLVMIKYKKY